MISTRAVRTKIKSALLKILNVNRNIKVKTMNVAREQLQREREAYDLFEYLMSSIIEEYRVDIKFYRRNEAEPKFKVNNTLKSHFKNEPGSVRLTQTNQTYTLHGPSRSVILDALEKVKKISQTYGFTMVV